MESAYARQAPCEGRLTVSWRWPILLRQRPAASPEPHQLRKQWCSSPFRSPPNSRPCASLRL